MDSFDNGDAAFPSDGGGVYAPWPGMDLRDYFAAKAMAAAISANDNSDGVPLKDMPRAIAKMAYIFADAMIAERKRT